jgi:hypothetical protein
MNADFAVYKVAVDGSQNRYDFTEGLTQQEAICPERFPFGVLTEPDGTKYRWGYGANNGIKF